MSSTVIYRSNLDTACGISGLAAKSPDELFAEQLMRAAQDLVAERVPITVHALADKTGRSHYRVRMYLQRNPLVRHRLGVTLRPRRGH